MKPPASEVIVEVGAEGGSVALYGILTNSGWRFSRHSIDQSAAFLGDPIEGMDSHVVASWDEAVKLLDAYPWHRLFPLQIHPDFREAVLEAVNARSSDAQDAAGNRLADWKTVCGACDE